MKGVELSFRAGSNVFLASTIAALLAVAHAPDVVAQNTLPAVIVTAPGGGGGWGGWGGGGGGGWGGASSTGPENPDYPSPCDAIQHAAAYFGCDLKNPPPLSPGGCGSKGSEWVPDGVPGYPALFTPACHAHDVCYGTFGQSKDGCDAQLGADLAGRCEAISSSDWGARAMCTTAATTYPVALRTLPQADAAYRTAQQEAQCRDLARDAEANVCP